MTIPEKLGLGIAVAVLGLIGFEIGSGGQVSLIHQQTAAVPWATIVKLPVSSTTPVPTSRVKLPVYASAPAPSTPTAPTASVTRAVTAPQAVGCPSSGSEQTFVYTTLPNGGHTSAYTHFACGVAQYGDVYQMPVMTIGSEVIPYSNGQ